MIQAIELEPAALTKTEGKWDPTENAVSYNNANYTSDTADGLYSAAAAQEVAERVDQIAIAEAERR